MSVISYPVLQIERLSPQIQLQDLGRFGQMHLGFSHSGAMDSLAFALNNELLDNSPNATQLEVALGGLVLRALNPCTLAISGAYAKAQLNGKPLVNFHSVTLAKNDKLTFAYAARGLYIYIAVKSGFSAPAILNSSATTKRLSIFPGGVLKEHSVLFSLGSNPLLKQDIGIKRHRLPDYSRRHIEVIPAYQYQQFSAQALHDFCRQAYRIEQSDRMGTRLSGTTPLVYNGEELLSEGLIPGAVQVTHEGQPIVLQKDAQTIGGYPKIGLLDDENRSLLSQIPSGHEVYFRIALTSSPA